MNHKGPKLTSSHLGNRSKLDNAYDELHCAFRSVWRDLGKETLRGNTDNINGPSKFDQAWLDSMDLADFKLIQKSDVALRLQSVEKKSN